MAVAGETALAWPYPGHTPIAISRARLGRQAFITRHPFCQKLPGLVTLGHSHTWSLSLLHTQSSLHRWIRDPVRVLVGKEGSMPSGLLHRYVVH